LSFVAPPVAHSLQGQRAGIFSRFLADAIDLLVVVVALVGVYFAVSAVRFLLQPRSFSWPEVSALNLGALGWILLIAYLTIGWANTGRTFGKSVLGLRVVSSRDEGLPCGGRSFGPVSALCSRSGWSGARSAPGTSRSRTSSSARPSSTTGGRDSLGCSSSSLRHLRAVGLVTEPRQREFV
jgi:hypothetical protein